MTGDELLEKVCELLVQHVGEAPDAAKPRAKVEAVAAAQAAAEAFHAFVCGGEGHCPREAANLLTEAMLNDIQSATNRLFGSTGFVQ